MRRTKVEAQATRTAILDAAERVFSVRGVARTSLADVAKAAGVTRGAIYWHFRDKAELFSAMLARVTLPLEASVRVADTPGGAEPLAGARNCMLGALTRTAEDPQAQRVFEIVCHKCEYVDEMAIVAERYVEMREGCLEKIEASIRAAARAGQLAGPVDARLAAVALHAMVDGLIHNWLLDRRYLSLAKDAPRLVEMFLSGLGAGAKRTTRARAVGERRPRRKVE